MKDRIMPCYAYVAHFVAGLFLANGLPHFVQGICGNKFQTPFATPRWIGESSTIVNVIWGGFNFVVGGALLRVFFPPLPAVSITTMFGVLSVALFLANLFGRVRNSAPHP